MKLKIILAAFVVVLFLIFQIPQLFNQKTRLIFCDVGEGDGAVLITPENVFLIDAGRDSRITDCLSRHLPFWRREITGVILTHPDADHIIGLKSVIQSYRIKWLLSNFSPNKTGEFRKIYDALINSGVSFKSFVSGEKIVINSKFETRNSKQIQNPNDKNSKLFENLNLKNFNIISNFGFRHSNLQIESFWPLNSHKEYESTNLFSTVSVVTIGESKFLMLADAEIATQIELMPEIVKSKSNYVVVETRDRASNDESHHAVEVANSDLKIKRDRETHNSASLQNINDWVAVKLSHHGSSKNFSYTLLREINPQYAIISVGKNSYGHPGKRVLELINNNKIKILRTDGSSRLRQGYGESKGDIVFECVKKCVLKI